MLHIFTEGYSMTTGDRLSAVMSLSPPVMVFFINPARRMIGRTLGPGRAAGSMKIHRQMAHSV